jgi:catechol 2,3-dioxygenase-like lactoylglutathione lyase family enzyme
MIRATEHFSFTVSDLDKALQFFRELLGLRAGPPVEVENEGVQKIIGMPGAKLRISMVELPGGGRIELIEYAKPRGAAIDLATCNTGVAHVAFGVDNIQKMYDDLSAKGVKFVSAPVWAPGADGKGRWAVCYLRGPDGITFELIERVD